MSMKESVLYRTLDHLHRVLRGVLAVEQGTGGPYGDSPNLPDIFYVDSGNGSDSNDGRDPAKPLATIDAAVGKCTASQGDVIMVQPGHAETLTATIALDVIGVSIVGIGEGTLRPQITVGADINGITISAANTSVENIYFNERTVTPTSDNAIIDIGAANVKIKRCHFDCGAEDLDTITLPAAGTSATIEDCEFHVTANGPETAIRIESASVSGLKVARCYFDGGSTTNSWDTGGIYSAVAHTLCDIRDCTFTYMKANIGGIEFTAAATGVLENNKFAGGTRAQSLDPGSCICINNYEQDAIDASAILVPDIDSDGTTGGGAHGAINDTTTDSLHGKLGTDTEMSDRSIWDILEGDGVVGGPTGTYPAANVNLADMLLWLSDGVRRGTGTTLPANISLYDLIGGSGGHPAWPTAAAYANDVSLMEVVAYIQDSLRPPAGAYIPGLGTQVTKAMNVQATTDDIFDVTGLVYVNLFFLVCTAAFDGTIGNLSFRIKTSNEPLCAATAVTSDTVDTLYLVTGQADAQLNGGLAPQPHHASATAEHDSATDRTPAQAPFILGSPSGSDTVEMLLSAADAATGAMTAYIYYIPLEASAAITASA